MNQLVSRAWRTFLASSQEKKNHVLRFSLAWCFFVNGTKRVSYTPPWLLTWVINIQTVLCYVMFGLSPLMTVLPFLELPCRRLICCVAQYKICTLVQLQYIGSLKIYTTVGFITDLHHYLRQHKSPSVPLTGKMPFSAQICWSLFNHQHNLSLISLLSHFILSILSQSHSL